MKNTFGQSVQVTLFGESHGEGVGAVIDGLCPGIEVDMEYINSQLSRRRPQSDVDTARKERDEFSILSGVFNGKTTGSPLAIFIKNEDKKSGDYEKTKEIARPSHADFSARMKYHGYEDYRGGGHFSGRVTAALVAVGAILKTALKKVGVEVGTHILSLGGVKDEKLKLKEEVSVLENRAFPVLDEGAEKGMTEAILKAKENLDSIGGVTETVVFGMVEGVGEPWFDSVESLLSHALFSIGGVKGVEFGAGFDGARNLFGSQFNDPFKTDGEKVWTLTNNNGGINGGITNGMPISFNCAVKPTPSIGKSQETVNFVKMENAELSVSGRHDPSIVRRICPVIDSVVAMVLCDILAMRFGTDVFLKGGLK